MTGQNPKQLDRTNAAIIATSLLLLTLLLIWLGLRGNNDAEKQPKLGLMTTLPLRWGEGDIGGIVAQKADPLPAYQRLSAKYNIKLMDAIDQQSLKSMHMLLMAQPRALTPAELVELDTWVRRGGHLMILADPALQWESRFGLGDKRRPLFTSLLSPLFQHWGLELSLPIGDGSGGEIIHDVEGFSIRTITPGRWQAIKGDRHAKCTVSDQAMVAKCRIGKGTALLLADADLLNDGFWAGTGVRAISGSDDFENMDWVEDQLARLWAHRDD